MIDFKKTLTNLHNEFPEFDLDTLMKIMDSIEEIYTSSISFQPGTRSLSSKIESRDNTLWRDITFSTSK